MDIDQTINMRKIKFRAWDKKNKKFWENDKIYGPGTYWDITPDGFVDATENNICRDSFDFVLLEFIGMIDKKGKEIYEGDIVNFGESNWIISWKNHFWQMVFKFPYISIVKFFSSFEQFYSPYMYSRFSYI